MNQSPVEKYAAKIRGQSVKLFHSRYHHAAGANLTAGVGASLKPVARIHALIECRKPILCSKHEPEQQKRGQQIMKNAAIIATLSKAAGPYKKR